MPGLLIDPDWLGDHIGDPRVRIVDLRDREAYGEAHIAGAVQLDLEDLGEYRDGCDNVVLRPADFERVMARLGISNRDTVVAYDDHWGLPAARLIWALHHYGVRSVGILNGGWDRWREEGRPGTDRTSAAGPSLETDDSPPQRAESPSPQRAESPPPQRAESPPPQRAEGFEAHLSPDVAADHEWIADRVGREGIVFLDTRSNTEFDQGHLPGAIAWDWFNAIPAESWECSRDSEELRSELARLGVHPSDEVVVYCRSGMRAAHTYVVLRHAGFPRVRLYDGSWQEWTMKGAAAADHHEKNHP